MNTTNRTIVPTVEISEEPILFDLMLMADEAEI